MIPALRKTSFSETPEEHVRNTETKKRLINELSNTVKELQKTHLEDDLDVDKNDQNALMLCTLLEAALLHGYQQTGIKMSNFYNLLGKVSAPSESMPSHSFWNHLVHFTHKDVVQELEHLSHITTPIGKCRAWIRLAINDCLIESYFDAMLSDSNKLRTYYKPGAFMLEAEMPYIMISFLQGIVDFKFHLNYNTPSLNNWTGDTLAYAGIWQLARIASHSPQSSHSHGPQFQASHSLSNSFNSTTTSLPTNKPINIVKTPSVEESTEVEVASSVKENDERDFAINVDSPIRDHDMTVLRPVDTENTADKLTDLNEEKPVTSHNADISCRQQRSSEDEEKLTAVDDPVHQSVDSRPAVVSPVPMLGSNKLGISTGWSSTFHTGPTSPVVLQTSVESKLHDNQSAITSKEVLRGHLLQDPETYNNLLSDYTVQKPATFNTLYDQEDGTRQMSIPRMKSPDQEPQMPGFEVVPQSSSVHSEHVDDRTQSLMSVLTVITNEKGLDNQNYQCNDCGRNIGMIYGEAKVCKYDSRYYCFECHVDDEHAIPARIIYNWDLRKHTVCRSTKLFLLQIEEEPLLNIDETNPSLYTVIEELQEIKMLRTQLQHLKGFLFTCKEPIAEEVRRRIWPREYLWDDIHQYSLLDLIQTNSGQLAHHLKKVITFCKKHVYRCQLCCQKGFICEFCNDPKIIYPFQIKTTTQCPKCKAVSHKACITDRKCPKCVRRQKLQAVKAIENNQLDFNSPWE